MQPRFSVVKQPFDHGLVALNSASLRLKLLQEETEASAHQYLLDFARQALLPSLSKNIVCGNSLIGTDILDGQLFAADEELKLKPMNFEDAFPEIINQGGFDTIIGNPPYGADFNDVSKSYIRENYQPQKCAIGSDLNPAPRGATVASMTKSRHRHRSGLADLAQGVAKG